MRFLVRSEVLFLIVTRCSSCVLILEQNSAVDGIFQEIYEILPQPSMLACIY